MLLIAAAWAFAEAILFFIVADVPISWIAVRGGWRAGLAAALAASVAAAAGGALLYGWAAADPAGARETIAALPGIDAAAIEAAAAGFARDGYWAMLRGSASGVPYKLYVLAAAGEGRALIPFLLLSTLVRLPRFAGAALAASGISRLLSGRLSMRARLGLLAAIWVAFYAFYFSVMPR
jgi:hypothetical protein